MSAELRELLARATPGPWTIIGRGGYFIGEEADVLAPGGEDIDGAEFTTPGRAATTRGQMMQRDAALIVAAVNALPGLLDEVESLRAEANALAIGNVSENCREKLQAARERLPEDEWRAICAMFVETERVLQGHKARASTLLARCEGLEAALTKLADHFKTCAVHKGYTNAAQAVYRGVAHEMEVALAATRTEVAPTSDTGGVP